MTTLRFNTVQGSQILNECGIDDVDKVKCVDNRHLSNSGEEYWDTWVSWKGIDLMVIVEDASISFTSLEV